MKFLSVIILLSSLFGQSLQLNEIVSSNASIIIDEDNDYSDWIEIYNSGQTSLQLKDYGLSDDLDKPLKWIFPELELEPQSFLILFASKKDRTNLVLQWDAIITESDQWHYWLGLSEPKSDWRISKNAPIDWSLGSSGFGYGDNDDNTLIDKTMSLFIRKSFNVDNPESIIKLLFHIDFDDGYIAYLNGEEFSRRNMGSPNSQVKYNSPATGLHEAEIYSGGFPEPIWIDLKKFPLIIGDNVLAIEVHNYNEGSSDLSCIPFLTVGYNSKKSNYRSLDLRMEIPPSFLHTNFKIINNNETIKIGKIQITAIHTPGHYFDSICYLIPPIIFTGDTMFVGRTGRVISSGSNIEELYNSIYNKILTLPNHTRIYPGHHYGDKKSISLKNNIKKSPLLQASSLDDFLKRMDEYEKNRKENH